MCSSNKGISGKLGIVARSNFPIDRQVSSPQGGIWFFRDVSYPVRQLN
jgi:hypothetical protein